MAIVDSKKLIFFDVKANHNKMWFIDLHDNGDVVTQWGRVGATLSTSTKNLFSESAGRKEFDKLVKSKLKKGYTELKVESSVSVKDSGSVALSKNFDLEQIALEDIDYDKSNTKLIDLIKLFCKENIHNITSNSNVIYDTKTGVFTTPGGIIVTKDAVQEARDILDKIQNHFNNKTLTGDDGLSLVEQYCNIIPTKVRGRVEIYKIFPTTESIDTQRSVLDSLEDSINTIEQIKNQPKDQSEDEVKVNRPKIFNTMFSKVEDQSIISDIKRLFDSTHNNIHSCRNLKVRNVYQVSIDVMNKNYQNTKDKWVKEGKTLNEKTLWHGTRKSNIISIFKSGLIIPPSNASFCVGRMFGNYLYFSDQSTKSLNYSYGYWGSGNRDNHCFMFLCDVLMGHEYIPRYSCSSIPAGYDSIFAKAGQSGVINNEMMVPVNQSRIKYLIEFSE